MGFHFRAEISHELFGKILMENQDRIIDGKRMNKSDYFHSGLNVQLASFSTQEILEIAAQCDARVEPSNLPYSYMTLSAIRNDARDLSNIDIAGFWGRS